MAQPFDAEEMHANVNPDSEPPMMVASLQLLRRYWKWIVATSFVVVAAAVAASLLMTRIYVGDVLVAYSSAQQGDQPLSMLARGLGGLAPLAGLAGVNTADARAEAIATLKSRTLSVQFIDRYHLMPVLFRSDWDASKGTWRVSGDDIPTEADAFKRFDEDVREISEDTATGLIRVAMYSPDRQQAAQWANALVRDANAFLRERALVESRKSIAQLQRELDNTNTLEIRQVIYGLFETQLSNATLANTREDYAFRVIDAAAVPDADDYVRPKPLLFIALAFLLGPTLGLLLGLMREAWSESR